MHEAPLSLTPAAAAMPSRPLSPPLPLDKHHARAPPTEIVISHARQLDSQEIRVGALVLSVLAFFFFIAAEIVSDERNVVLTLVALGSLGFAWIGPLTLLAGSLKSPKFKWWQPFQGGVEFVWMQAFGWSLHTLVLTGAVILLANTNRVLDDGKWMEGQYVLLGVTGFVAQILLNLSIGIFDENDVHDPQAMHEAAPLFLAQKQFPWNAKAIVSMLVSLSGAMLCVIFDLYADRLQSTVVIVAACAEFTLSAVMIHVFYGCKEIPGYRLWMPFEGERFFLLMQYLGWQFFTCTVVGTMMLCVSTDFTASPAVSRGAPTLVGAMGLISQITLLISLQHFTPTSTLDTGGSSPTKFNRAKLKRPPEVYVSTLLCTGAVAVGCVSYAARVESVAALSAWRSMYLPHEKIFWVVSMVALGISSPIAHAGAVRAYRQFGWWQPFIGGTKFVFLQTLGWLWFGFFGASSMLLVLNNANFAEKVAPFSLIVGCAATAAIGTSLPYFEADTTTSGSPTRRSFASASTSPLSLEKAASRSRTRQSALQQGEITISLLMTVSSIICHVVADFFRHEFDEQTPQEATLRLVALGIGTLLFAVGCFLTHASGNRLFENYKLWQPFQGGPQFVVRQAIGWTLFGVQMLFETLIISVPAQSLPLGVVSGIGVIGLIPHLVIVSSIRYFRSCGTSTRRSNSRPLTPTVSPRILKAPRNTSWRALLHRPDVFSLFFVNGFIILGSLLLFLGAHVFHQNERFRHADEVMYTFGFVVSVGAIVFTHVALGPRIQPGYRYFQPFQGGLRFITYQGVAWTLASVAWVAACTALYWPHVFFQFRAIHLLTGLVFFIAQCVLLHSLPHFKPPHSTTWSACPKFLRVHLAKIENFTHDLFVGPLLGMAACVVFVLVDLSMNFMGPIVPVFPITVCAVVALFSAIPMAYKFARSTMGVPAKSLGGSVVSLVLGSALWSFTILLGALFCYNVWGMESSVSLSVGSLVPPPPPSSSLSTNYMGTFTGTVGFVAQLVFFQASDAKMSSGSPSTSPSGARRSSTAAARAAARRAKDHLISASLWLYSSVAVAIGFVYAYSTSFKASRQLTAHQLMAMALCSFAVIGCAYLIQRQILFTDTSTHGHDSLAYYDKRHSESVLSEAALVQLETNAFAHVAAFLTVAEVIRVSSTCRSFHRSHDESFWRRQFIDRFARASSLLSEKTSLSKLWVNASMPREGPAFVMPFASKWMTLFEDRLLNAVCRLQLQALTTSDLDQTHPQLAPPNRLPALRHKWRTMCLSREQNCWCDQCQLCGKLEILTETSREWEKRRSCALRVPSTWVRVCHCVNPTTLGVRRAHRVCLERARPEDMKPCPTCEQMPQRSVRYPQTMAELAGLTWTDFRTGREDFAGGFFSFVPMAVTLVVLSARTFQFGGCSLYVWVCYAMALCFVSNTPRISQSFERIGGDETSRNYLAYQRLIHALTLPSMAHVLWCLATSPLGVLDVFLAMNFVLLGGFASALLLLYWRSSYRVETFQSCRPKLSTSESDEIPTDVGTADDANANANANADEEEAEDDPLDHTCIACLLELCTDQ